MVCRKAAYISMISSLLSLSPSTHTFSYTHTYTRGEMHCRWLAGWLGHFPSFALRVNALSPIFEVHMQYEKRLQSTLYSVLWRLLSLGLSQALQLILLSSNRWLFPLPETCIFASSWKDSWLHYRCIRYRGLLDYSVWRKHGNVFKSEE